VVQYPNLAYFNLLIIILSIFNRNQLFDISYSEVIFEFELSFFVKLLKVHFVAFEIIIEELAGLVILKEIVKRTIEYFLYNFKLVLWVLVEISLINSPIF